MAKATAKKVDKEMQELKKQMYLRARYLSGFYHCVFKGERFVDSTTGGLFKKVKKHYLKCKENK